MTAGEVRGKGCAGPEDGSPIRGAGGKDAVRKTTRTKATREDMEGDEALKLFDSVMEECGIAVTDEKHPLSQYQANHLLVTLNHVCFDGKRSSLNAAIRTFFEMYGYGVSRQTVSGWLRDSRTIQRLQLARVVDLIARFVASDNTAKSFEDVAALAVDLDPFSGPSQDYLYRVAFRYIVVSLFGMTQQDKNRVMASAIISDVMGLSAGELYSLVATIRVMRPGGACSSAFAALASAEPLDETDAQKVLSGMEVLREGVERTMDWARDCRVTQPEPESDGLPF